MTLGGKHSITVRAPDGYVLGLIGFIALIIL